MTRELAWDFPLDEEETHCCLREASFDHWFRRFRCAAGLHSLFTDGGSGEGLALGLDGGLEIEEEEEEREQESASGSGVSITGVPGCSAIDDAKVSTQITRPWGRS